MIIICGVIYDSCVEGEKEETVHCDENNNENCEETAVVNEE
jgi:hypothetical protein